MVHKPGKRLVRFGLFELDLEAGELRKQGVKLQLQPKPLQMLQILLERPGEIVSRQELCRRLWGGETFVDFESGLNTAANRLRLKLGDSAESPRYIETVARNGYRFVAPVASVDWALPETEPERPAAQPQSVPKRRLMPVAVLALTAVLAILFAAYFVFGAAPTARAHFRQLTFRAGQVSGARFTPDGHAVLYSAQWNGEPRQLYLTSAVAPESRLLGFPDMSLAAVSSLGELALLNGGGTMNIGGGKLSRVPMNGGSPLLLDQGIVAAEWSRDGRAIALVRASKGASQLEFPPRAAKIAIRFGWNRLISYRRGAVQNLFVPFVQGQDIDGAVCAHVQALDIHQEVAIVGAPARIQNRFHLPVALEEQNLTGRSLP
jgi:DNA-binding winged helix-turn-helix (wHTH) protein